MMTGYNTAVRCFYTHAGTQAPAVHCMLWKKGCVHVCVCVWVWDVFTGCSDYLSRMRVLDAIRDCGKFPIL